MSCAAMNATEFLTKPFVPADVLERLALHLPMTAERDEELTGIVAGSDRRQVQDFFCPANRSELAANMGNRPARRSSWTSALRRLGGRLAREAKA